MHRDLTTNNVMISEEPPAQPGVASVIRAKISDVGAARLLEGKQVQAMTLNPGAQVFMGPEAKVEMYKDKAVYGFSADIYSLGATILAMCIRCEPDTHVLAKEGRKKYLAALRKEHPLHSVTAMCLNEDPEKRPAAKSVCNAICSVAPKDQKFKGYFPTCTLFSPVARQADAASGFNPLHVGVPSGADQHTELSLNRQLEAAKAESAHHKAELEEAKQRHGEYMQQRNRESIVLSRDLMLSRQRCADMEEQLRQLNENYDRLRDDRRRLVEERDTAREKFTATNEELAVVKRFSASINTAAATADSPGYDLRDKRSMSSPPRRTGHRAVRTSQRGPLFRHNKHGKLARLQHLFDQDSGGLAELAEKPKVRRRSIQSCTTVVDFNYNEYVWEHDVMSCESV